MIAWNREVIVVGHEDVQGLIGLDIIAVQIAEAGAMGYMGGVFIVTEDTHVFFTRLLGKGNYEGSHAEMSDDDIERIVPFLSGFRPGLLGRGGKYPEGWHYYYLGMGNHLLIMSAYQGRFEHRAQQLQEQEPEAILYNLWLSAILDTIGGGEESSDKVSNNP